MRVNNKSNEKQQKFRFGIKYISIKHCICVKKYLFPLM